MSTTLRYVGLDVHKESITIAVAESDRTPAREFTTVANDWPKLHRALKRLSPTPATLRCCYEAGMTGYGLHRRMKKAGIDCVVIAPALVPKQPGNHIKTDRRDAAKLAHFLRSGDLTPIYVPDEECEALRDLERSREAAVRAERVARQHLRSFLLRHERPYHRTQWTWDHIDWIRKQKFDNPMLQQVLCDYIKVTEDAGERLKQVTADLEEHAQQTCLWPLIKALQALRGIRLVTAASIAAEIGDFRRFKSARQFMAYLGLVPSEYSSGESSRRGRITRCGNRWVRTLLIESSWHYRFPPKMSRQLRARNQGVAPGVQRIAWKAQHRLHKRLYRLTARGKRSQQAVVAIARELAGFIWAVGQEAELLADAT
jgi:transposase